MERLAAQELDRLRAAVIDGVAKREIKKRGLRLWRGFSDAECVRSFMRHRRDIRGTEEWGKERKKKSARVERAPGGERRRFLSTFPSELKSIARKRWGYRGDIEDWLEELEFAEAKADEDAEDAALTAGLTDIVALLDRTYYQVLDLLLLPLYERICTAELAARFDHVKRGRAAAASPQAEAPRKVHAQDPLPVQLRELLEVMDEQVPSDDPVWLEAATEFDRDDYDSVDITLESAMGPLADAYSLGLFGGFTPHGQPLPRAASVVLSNLSGSARRRSRAGASLKRPSVTSAMTNAPTESMRAPRANQDILRLPLPKKPHTLPCYRTLIVDVAGVLPHLGVAEDKRTRLIDQLLCVFFRDWYHNKVDARRVRRVLGRSKQT